MLYRVLKIIARLAFPLYCRNLRLLKKEALQYEGPLLIACNHPNSFLDAIIIDTLFKRPVYSLARGDAFKGKFLTRLLLSLKMFPVYRASEGVENLEQNYTTFEKCKKQFRQNGIVLIFSEGRCINEWDLRPLMKGTARLAVASWDEGIPLKVLPTGINYSSFTSFGKNIQLNFGNIFSKEIIAEETSQGKNILSFNKRLKEELEKLVIVDPGNAAKTYDMPTIGKIRPRSVPSENIKRQFEIRQSPLKKILLFLPACLGFLLHLPLYLPLKKYVWARASTNDHYDSLMVGILMFSYPFYLLLITLTLFFIFKLPVIFLLLLMLPFTAWSHVQLKKQF